MKSVITNSVIEITITLTEDEANWLHEVTQNPINYDNPERESTRDAEMRAKFWNATKIPQIHQR